MTKSIRFAIYLLIFSLFVISCKKEDSDNTLPTIEISQPIANQIYHYGDTVWVAAQVADNVHLKSVTSEIVTQNGMGITPKIVCYDAGCAHALSLFFVLDNPLIETGVHYVNLVAFDGTNQKTARQPIYIQALPRKFLGLVYVASSGTNSIQIRHLDTTGSDQPRLSLSGDYSCSAITSKYRKLFVAGALHGQMNAVNLADFSVDWSLENLSNNSLPWFSTLAYENSTLYVATQDGVISGYSNGGMRIAYYTIGGNLHAVNLAQADNRLVAATQNIGNSATQLTQFYTSSRLLIHKQAVPFTVCKMFPRAAEEVYLFANVNNAGTILNYNCTLQSYSELHAVEGETILDVVMVEARHYLILTSTGVYWYNNQQVNSLVRIAATQGGAQLLFDDLSQQFFVVKGQYIELYSFPTGVLQQTISTADPILNAHLYYNR